MVVLCYERCSTCKKALQWLDDHKVSYTKREIDKKNPNQKELKAWHKASGLPLKRFFNTSGLKYKEFQLKDRLPEMSEAEQIRLLASDGLLVKRPLVVTDDGRVLVGFKEEEWKTLL